MIRKGYYYFLAVCLIASITPAAWAGSITVKEEIVIHEPADKIWPLIKNFGDIDQWHPAVAKTTSQGGNKPGAKRVLTLGDPNNGPKIYETLTKYSNKAMSMTYVITKMNPSDVLPVKNYESYIRVEREGSRSEIEWHGTFDSANPEMSDEEIKKAIAGVYRAGLDNLHKMAMFK